MRRIISIAAALVISHSAIAEPMGKQENRLFEMIGEINCNTFRFVLNSKDKEFGQMRFLILGYIIGRTQESPSATNGPISLTETACIVYPDSDLITAVDMIAGERTNRNRFKNPAQ
ncbi:hypothetical protein O4H61_03415 [Roseovarius aestuarii]|nr:hypothetical protein [Roseovarius aestuarii]